MAHKEDYLNERTIPVIDEIDRYLSTLQKIEYPEAKSSGNLEGDPAVIYDYPELLTSADLPRTKKDLERMRPSVAMEGLVYKGGSLSIGGTTKVGKSIVVSSLIMAAANGGTFMGKKMKKMKVLLIDLEVLWYEIFKRLHGIAPKDEDGTAQYSENLFILSLRKHPDLLDREKLLPFIQKLKDQHNFDLIVLDCAYQIMGGLDENANGQMTELGRFFTALQKEIPHWL